MLRAAVATPVKQRRHCAAVSPPFVAIEQQSAGLFITKARRVRRYEPRQS